MDSVTQAVPVPARLDKIESVLETVTGAIDKFGSVISTLLPAAAPILAGVDAVGHVAEEVIGEFDGKSAVDAAALAAGSISKSTGNASLDSRLAAIETLLIAAVPVLRYLAKEFGLTFDVPTAAPMSVTASDAAPVQSASADA